MISGFSSTNYLDWFSIDPGLLNGKELIIKVHEKISKAYADESKRDESRIYEFVKNNRWAFREKWVVDKCEKWRMEGKTKKLGRLFNSYIPQKSSKQLESLSIDIESQIRAEIKILELVSSGDSFEKSYRYVYRNWATLFPDLESNRITVWTMKKAHSKVFRPKIKNHEAKIKNGRIRKSGYKPLLKYYPDHEFDYFGFCGYLRDYLKTFKKYIKEEAWTKY